MPITDFTPSTLIQSAQVDANFALCVLTDTARTIGVKHTISVQNPFAFTHADWVDGALPYTTSDNLTALALGTGRQLLQVNAGATAPQWTSNVDIPGTLDVTGAGVFDSTLAVAGATTVAALTASGAVTLTAALTTANGGTGLASYTAGDLIYYAAGTLFTKLGIGAANTVLTSSGTAPQWVNSLSLGGTLGVTGATTVAAITASGAVIAQSTLAVTSTSTLTGDVIASVIRRATSDAADNSSVTIAGGGASGVTRGAHIIAHGNESLGNEGNLLLLSGNNTTSSVIITPASGGSVQLNTGVASPSVRVSSSITARDTFLEVYDVDNADIERVTVGSADSGGAGFKLLRIPN